LDGERSGHKQGKKQGPIIAADALVVSAYRTGSLPLLRQGGRAGKPYDGSYRSLEPGGKVHEGQHSRLLQGVQQQEKISSAPRMGRIFEFILIVFLSNPIG
jgi:hypothetical protein